MNSAPIPSPEANPEPEPCLEIIFSILQLFLTTPRPRRREYTTPDDFDPETEEPTTELPGTGNPPTEGNSSGESADGPAVDDGSGTTEGNPDEIPNEIIPRNADTLKKLKKPKKKQNDWWFGGLKW